MGFLCGWLRRQWLLSKTSLPRRVALFFAIYLAAAALLSIRVPVVVTGVAYEEGGTRAYSNETGEYALTLMTDGDAPTNLRAIDLGVNSDGWDVKNEESPATLNTNRYTSRLEILFAVLGVLWFGVIPYFSQLRRCAGLLPLLVYAIAAIWRLVYVPCIEVFHRTYPAVRDQVFVTSLFVWDVGKWNVRYDLVLYEELVLLAIVAGCYGAAFAVDRHLHPRHVSV